MQTQSGNALKSISPLSRVVSPSAFTKNVRSLAKALARCWDCRRRRVRYRASCSTSLRIGATTPIYCNRALGHFCVQAHRVTVGHTCVQPTPVADRRWAWNSRSTSSDRVGLAQVGAEVLQAGGPAHTPECDCPVHCVTSWRGPILPTGWGGLAPR